MHDVSCGGGGGGERMDVVVGHSRSYLVSVVRPYLTTNAVSTVSI